jgi:hypothetical protein
MFGETKSSSPWTSNSASQPDDPRGEPTRIELPFTGKIDVRAKLEKVVWKSETGEKFEFPFTFYYSESGVWVRVEYKGPGIQYEDYPGVEALYTGVGEKIVGLPGKPSKMSIQEFLTMGRNRVALEKASRIVIDHVLLLAEPYEAEPYLILKVWGVDKPWSDSPDNIPRIRIILGLDSGRGFVDDAL